MFQTSRELTLRVLTFFQNESNWRTIYQYQLRILAVGLGLMCLGSALSSLRIIPNLGVFSALGLIVFDGALLLAAWGTGLVLFQRATDLSEVHDDEYPMLRFAAFNARTFFEAAGAFSGVTTLGLFVTILLAGQDAAYFTSGMGLFALNSNTFLGAVFTLFFGSLISISCFSFGHVFHESAVLLINIARDVRELRPADGHPPLKRVA